MQNQIETKVLPEISARHLGHGKKIAHMTNYQFTASQGQFLLLMSGRFAVLQDDPGLHGRVLWNELQWGWCPGRKSNVLDTLNIQQPEIMA